MPIGKFLYFGDFAVIPVAVLPFAGVALFDRGLEAALAWALSLIVGIVVWTLIEYLVHRFLYHGAPMLTRCTTRIIAIPPPTSAFRPSCPAD